MTLSQVSQCARHINRHEYAIWAFSNADEFHHDILALILVVVSTEPGLSIALRLSSLHTGQ